MNTSLHYFLNVHLRTYFNSFGFLAFSRKYCSVLHPGKVPVFLFFSVPHQFKQIFVASPEANLEELFCFSSKLLMLDNQNLDPINEGL